MSCNMPPRVSFRANPPSSSQYGCCSRLRDGTSSKPTGYRQVHDQWVKDLIINTSILRNPGTVEELHAKWREMLPMPFVGAKLLVQKGLSNNFQVQTTMNT